MARKSIQPARAFPDVRSAVCKLDVRRTATPSFPQELSELVGIVRARFRSALRKLWVKALQGRFDRLHPLRCGELNGQLRGRIMQDISRVR